jgi:NAD(P)-dependent dehydrogenase (short-subunit alcohol dehydrogenase family)
VSPQPLSILVTGASSGIGLAAARQLAAAGHRVVGTSRSPRSDDERPFEMATMDVLDAESVEACVAAVLAQGPIDVLVNSAGFGLAGALEDTSDAEALLQFDTNLLGVHRVCRAVLPSMRARGAGRIVNIGSMGGSFTVPFQGLYCASKAALRSYTESLRMEVRPFGITATVIEPGDFATGFTDSRRYTERSGEGSAYQAAMRVTMDICERDERAGGDPAMVAQAVTTAIGAANPRGRYVVAALLLQRLAPAIKWLLPAALFEAIMRDTYKIG